MADEQAAQPLPLTPVNQNAAVGQPTAPIAAPGPGALDDKVDQWLDAHPADKSFDEPQAASTEEPTPAPAPEVEPGEQEPAPGTADAPPPGEAKAAAPVVEAKVEPTEQQPPPSEAPAAPAAETRFSLDTKYVFGEGTTPWTGQQIVDGLRERQELIPKAQDLETYQELFQMPAAQAKELWEPNLRWMRANPQHVGVIASMMADPQKAQYLLNCSEYYETPEAREQRGVAPAAAEPSLQMSPEVEARFKALETQNQQLLAAEKGRKDQYFLNRVTRDLNTAFERYPYLRDNPTMVQSLLLRAKLVNGGDDSENCKGVLDALDMDRELYDAKLAALNGATQIAQAAAAPQVPPLVGSTGAQPHPSVSARAVAPKKFGTLDDAVDDWVSNPPTQFR